MGEVLSSAVDVVVAGVLVVTTAEWDCQDVVVVGLVVVVVGVLLVPDGKEARWVRVLRVRGAPSSPDANAAAPTGMAREGLAVQFRFLGMRRVAIPSFTVIPNWSSM